MLKVRVKIGHTNAIGPVVINKYLPQCGVVHLIGISYRPGCEP